MDGEEERERSSGGCKKENGRLYFGRRKEKDKDLLYVIDRLVDVTNAHK